MGASVTDGPQPSGDRGLLQRTNEAKTRRGRAGTAYGRWRLSPRKAMASVRKGGLHDPAPTRYFPARLVPTILAALLTGCGGGGGSSSTLRAAPSVSISVSPSPASIGATATLTWSASNATSCIASGAWSGTQGTSGT